MKEEALVILRKVVVAAAAAAVVAITGHFVEKIKQLGPLPSKYGVSSSESVSSVE